MVFRSHVLLTAVRTVPVSLFRTISHASRRALPTPTLTPVSRRLNVDFAPSRTLKTGSISYINESTSLTRSRLVEHPIGEMGDVSRDADRCLDGLDSVQAKLMEEECILVDNEDRPIGAASKKVCHLMTNIDKGMLHRAFSVFLFNSKGELLIQQRAPAKITFPRHWTNTCCSHPLSFAAEREEGGEAEGGEALGVRRAARRKLEHELGIQPDQVPLDAFHYLTRIHYKSPNVPADGTWGEHEIDYILFVQRDVTLTPNDNEVMDQRYVNRDQLHELIESSSDGSTLVTPWFKLIVDHFLPLWWSKLDDLKSCVDRRTIHRMC